MQRKERLDQLLVTRGLVRSRAEATRLILAGLVRVGGERVDKTGRAVAVGAPVEVKAVSPFVSRGGDKLAHALDAFGIAVEGRTCVDVGASTGGFTHCLVARGARLVYAVEVGAGQLDLRFRTHPRVVVMEKTNARFLAPSAFATPPDLATVDVSFISLEKVLPAIFGILAGLREVVALVKPQFEVGRSQVGKRGVVRDPLLHRAVLLRVIRFAQGQGWPLVGLTISPLRGPKGNREFFLHLSPGRPGLSDPEAIIAQAVDGGAEA
ncbi:MAG: TlyA family RNA methyltransferase [Candidatus Methylomirabilia bacterium]